MTARETLVFPGAGSFGGEFGRFTDELGATRIRYPGRFADPPAGSPEELVAACVDQVRSRDGAHPVLLGHSFGAYVAFAATAELEGTDHEPSLLVVLGAKAPDELDAADLPDDSPGAVEAYLRWVDPELLDGLPDPEWAGIVVETAADDLRLLRRFPSLDDRSVPCPVAAGRGEADVLVSDDELRSWERATRGGLTRRTFPGGHSDHLGSDDQVAWLRDLAG